MDVNAQTVATVMDKHNVEILVHGHTHRPNRHALASGERIVLGDWHDLGWVLCLDDSGYNLASFVISSQK